MADNIYKKLLAISAELSAVAKNLEVGYGQNKYKAVSEGDVLSAIKPLEAKYGVYSYPSSRTIIESGYIERVDAKTGLVKKDLFERIETIYRFVNVDDPNDYISVTTYGDGIDSQDKSVGKAMTYADKYALLKAYKIITGEDPDQDESKDIVVAQKVEPKKKEPLSEAILNEVKNLGITIEQIASLYKKEVDDLTEAEVSKIVIMTKNKRKKQEQDKIVKEVQPQVAPQPSDDWIEEV